MAQQPGRTYRLGFLYPTTRDVDCTPSCSFFVRFFDEVRRRGFIEGTVDFRSFAPRLDLISQYASELVTARPDVIYAGGGVATRALQQATKSIPIVTLTDDIVGEGLVDALGIKQTFVGDRDQR
jgi:putative ABC transport system substrate-binding protein